MAAPRLHIYAPKGENQPAQIVATREGLQSLQIQINNALSAMPPVGTTAPPPPVPPPATNYADYSDKKGDTFELTVRGVMSDERMERLNLPYEQ